MGLGCLIFFSAEVNVIMISVLSKSYAGFRFKVILFFVGTLTCGFIKNSQEVSLQICQESFSRQEYF